jgi:hypothetical protein
MRSTQVLFNRVIREVLKRHVILTRAVLYGGVRIPDLDEKVLEQPALFADQILDNTHITQD